MGQLISSVWEGELTAAITLPGDRRDDLVAQSSQAIATWFDRVVIYEDDDLRGRAPGEMRTLIDAALRATRPGIVIADADGPLDALRTSVALAAGGPVLFLHEKLSAATVALDTLGATPWPEEDLLAELTGGSLLADLNTELAQDTCDAGAIESDLGPAPIPGAS